MTNIIIDESKDILNVFHDVAKTKKTVICASGRSTGKSTNIARMLVLDFLEDKDCNVICFRKYQNTLKGSMYTEIEKYIYSIGLEKAFDFIPSRLLIMHKQWQTGFYFMGMDKVDKIKSTKMKTGYPNRLWFEEFQENDTIDQLDMIEDIIVTFEREILPKNKYHQVIYSLNPPRNEHHIINVWLQRKREEQNENELIHYSTYEQVTDEYGESLLSKQLIDRIELTKEKDYDTFEWRYLGKAVGEKLKIYNTELFKVVDELPQGEQIIYFDTVTDTGYQVSATVPSAWGVTNKLNLVLIDLEYYSPDAKIKERYPTELHKYIRTPVNGVKLAPSDFSKIIYNFGRRVQKAIRKPLNKEIGDSADGGIKTQYYRDYGIRLKGVNKLMKNDTAKGKEFMVEKSRDAMIERTVYIMNKPQNKLFLFEAQKYQLDKDKYNKGEFAVVKEDDHLVDDFQYMVIENLKTLGLKV